MRQVRYTVYDLAGEEAKEASLTDFLLEIPALIVHGVIAPFAVTNQILELGNLGGGMSPGIEWRPFRISRDEYAETISSLRERLKHGRVPGPHSTMIEKAIVDRDFDEHTEWDTWVKDVTEKYTGRIVDIPVDEE